MKFGLDKMAIGWGWLVLALAFALTGCLTQAERRKAQDANPGPIDALVLLTAPAAIDSQPPIGPDAIAVRIYATASTRPKAIVISDGTLEVYMFDGLINEKTSHNVKPLKVWTRPADELRQFASKTAIGVSYSMTLLWGSAKPRQDNITIVARYLNPAGRSIYSSPSTIPVGTREQ